MNIYSMLKNLLSEYPKSDKLSTPNRTYTQSTVETSSQPDYSLSEDEILALQKKAQYSRLTNLVQKY